ncbi:MAG: hypothetical protein EPN94_10970 [Nitrospirae bacterium]|nr:MAG: hypothetical protein EPN94_10970 [Nitrospirota bacterium]
MQKEVPADDEGEEGLKMEKLCGVCRKIPTNHPDGRCAVCRVDGKPLPVSKYEDNSPAIRDVKTEVTKTKKEKKNMSERNYKGHQKCGDETCAKYAVKEGLCVTHYKEKHGVSPYASKKKVTSPAPLKSGGEQGDMCSIEGCGNAIKSGGLCNKHYLRELKAGRVGKKSGKRKYTKKKDKNVPAVSATPCYGPSGKANLSLKILLDLKEFPKIHGYCTALDFINPSDMLGVVLRNRLKELEEVIAR